MTHLTDLDTLLDSIARGDMPPIPHALAALARDAAATPPPADVDAWAARLAADIADAGPYG